MRISGQDSVQRWGWGKGITQETVEHPGAGHDSSKDGTREADDRGTLEEGAAAKKGQGYYQRLSQQEWPERSTHPSPLPAYLAPMSPIGQNQPARPHPEREPRRCYSRAWSAGTERAGSWLLQERT